MIVAEFLDWTPPTDSDRWELIDGTPRAMAPNSPRHGAICAEVARLVGNHLYHARPGPGCRVMMEVGVQPFIGAEDNVRVPDLAISCAPWARDDRLLTEPLILAEILSPSSPKDTWSNVESYLSIPSVVEVLVIHAEAMRADLFRRGSDGDWPEDPLPLRMGDSVHLGSRQE